MLDEIKEFPKVTVILRGYTYESIRSVVTAMVGTKLRSVEITMNTENALDIIKKIAAEFQDQIYVGAGTVLNLQEAKDCIHAGAKFILSPICLDAEVIDYCNQHGVVSVPAAYTPTEIHQMLKVGASIVKVFPAGRLQPKYFSDIQAPLGKMPLMVVGGISADNVNEYFEANVQFAGIGSGIFKKEDIENCNLVALKESIKRFEERVDWRM